MIEMKCPRCNSNFLRTEHDRYGAYALCLTCGWTDNGIGGEVETPDGHSAGAAEPVAKASRNMPALQEKDNGEHVEAMEEARARPLSALRARWMVGEERS